MAVFLETAENQSAIPMFDTLKEFKSLKSGG